MVEKVTVTTPLADRVNQVRAAQRVEAVLSWQRYRSLILPGRFLQRWWLHTPALIGL
ncbi:MAG: hypothetical protein P8X54_11235 [Desulfuromonadales bacterium]